MPKTVNVLRKAHSVLSASVEPTKQAFVLPTKFKRVSPINLPKYFSAVPECYAIRIIGEAYSYTTMQSREVEIQRIYRAYHPTCAIGRAVLDFLKDNARATISQVEILKAL